MTKPPAMPEPIKTAVSKLKSAQMCHPNAVQHLIEEALAALQSAQPAEPEQSTRLRGGVPGWKLVPVEPTPEMLEAGLKRKALERWADGYSAIRSSTAQLRPTLQVAAIQWQAMLTAAPQAPAQDAGAVRDATKWNALTEAALDSFLEDYEMCGEAEDGRDAVHTPTEGERALIKDAVMGFLVEAEAAAMSAQGGA